MKKLLIIRRRGIILLLVFCLSCVSSVKKKSSPVLVSVANKKIVSLPCEIIIGYIIPQSSVERAGLKTGDRVLKVNGSSVNSYQEFINALRRLSEETKNIFTVLRDNREINVAFIPDTGRPRLGFRFKTRDPEITKQIKFDIWPSEVNPNIRRFSIFFHAAALMSRSSRSPKRKVLQRIKEILLNKGYLFTENYEEVDFFVETKYKNAKKKTDPSRPRVKRIVPFEAFRVLFLDKNDKKPFLKVSGTIDQEKARIYGAKEYVYSMLDAMIEKFPSCPHQKKSSNNLATFEKKKTDDKPPASEKQFPGAGLY